LAMMSSPCSADGAFAPDGGFVPLPAVPEGLLAEGFRRAVLGFLVEKGAVSEDLRRKLLGWRYSGFSVHNQVRVGEGDAEGRKKLAGYLLRAPMSLEKMHYDADTGTVIYRSKMHLGLKRNFQVMPGAEWLELLLRHAPERYEHLVRYVGWYSNRAGGAPARERRRIQQCELKRPRCGRNRRLSPRKALRALSCVWAVGAASPALVWADDATLAEARRLFTKAAVPACAICHTPGVGRRDRRSRTQPRRAEARCSARRQGVARRRRQHEALSRQPDGGADPCARGVWRTRKRRSKVMSAGKFRRDLEAGMAAMMRDMHAPGYTGNPDIDFLAMMIPHHQGAIDMARLALIHGRDPATRRLAEDIIAGQQVEIEGMQRRLAALRGQERDVFPELGGTRGARRRP